MITEAQLFTELGTFLQVLLPGVEIVRGLDNRVSMPVGGFAVLTGSGLVDLAQQQSIYDGIAENVSISVPKQWTVGFDFYGPLAQDWAVRVSTVFRSPYACDQLADLQPLYAGDTVQFPLVDGEAQYEERWRFDAVFQYTPIVVLGQESATALDLDLISVDATYPPGA